MWDGQIYNVEEQAQEKSVAYAIDGFEVKSFVEGGRYYLFTRREANPVVNN